jgi:ferredoxin
MTLTPHIDELACAAHGDCALAAPEVFTIEDIATVTGNGSSETILEAARTCPAGAILVIEEQQASRFFRDRNGARCGERCWVHASAALPSESATGLGRRPARAGLLYGATCSELSGEGVLGNARQLVAAV